MRMAVKSLVMVAIAIAIAGCGTPLPGSRESFALVDIDLRSPEQIKAGLQEEETLGATPIDVGAVARLIEAIKGRIRILTFERRGMRE